MKKSNPSNQIIPQKIKDVFNLSFSRRYHCPNPSHQGSSESYNLEYNFCYSCKFKANDVASMINRLSIENKSVFKNIISIQEANSILKTNSIPSFFNKKKTREEWLEESKRQDDAIVKLLSSCNARNQYGTFTVPDSKVAHFIKVFNLEPTKVPTPLIIDFQNTKYTKNISFGNPPFTIGSNFFKGAYNPTKLKFVDTPKEVIHFRDTSDTYASTLSTSINNTILKHLSSNKITNIEVPDEESFNMLLGEIISKQLNLPNFKITSTNRDIPALTFEQLTEYFINTDRLPPEGANYLNIDEKREYDDLLTLGNKNVVFNDSLTDDKKLLIKTGGLPVSHLLTNTTPQKNSPFISSGTEVDNVLSLLKFREPTSNIKKEIQLLESLSESQRKSLDLQLQVAKAVKALFPGEYYGVKGSANNLNILFEMGITSLDPSRDPLLSPYSFLDPSTNKNPDIDFELSSSQIKKLVSKYPTLTKGLSVTKAGDRVHVCKFFIDVPPEYKKFQNGDYIPKDSKIIEESGATPVDLIASRVIDNMNDISSNLGNPTIPNDYSINLSDIQNHNLPHFNDAVQSQMKKKNLLVKGKDFSTEELASICALNRPIFYYSMVVLKDNAGKTFYFSHSGKRGAEALYPMDKRSEDALRKYITQDDIRGIDYASKKIGDLNVHFMKSSYLVSPPQWVKCPEDEILTPTDGVIVYQDQLMLVLEKYTELTPQEINDVLKKIAHPTKSEDLNVKQFFDFNPNTPDSIKTQVKFITSSQNAFFFKKGHALFLAETARKMSYLKNLASNAMQKSKTLDLNLTKPL